MGRARFHDSVNHRMKAHRHSKNIKNNKKVFCAVCDEDIICTGSSYLSIISHKSKSEKHKRLLLQRNKVAASVSDDVDHQLEPDQSVDVSLQSPELSQLLTENYIRNDHKSSFPETMDVDEDFVEDLVEDVNANIDVVTDDA